MQTMRPLIRTLAALFLLAIPSLMAASPTEPGVSHALAIARAARLSNLRYALSFTLKEHASEIEGTETLTFTSSTAGDLPIDYRDGTVRSATLNGQPIPLTEENGHLHLPTKGGENTLAIAFTSKAAPAGKAITRYEDKDDGNEYFYTLFVPMDASMAFPCFDQPDLKARFSLQVYHPERWTVLSNTTGDHVTKSGTVAVSVFAETRPISTYLFAFAAGPWQAIGSSNRAEPTLYVRKSQLARAQNEAPAVQQTAARGIAWLSDYFHQPFPFPKYDLVLIPGFPFGGMEHAGATFLNEDGVLFRSAPTESDYFRRKILVLHETCHQWFGDLVTMRWFDDLWLKEGFAQYMAYKTLAALEPATQPWKHFYEDIKPLAYSIDETQGTTPIFQTIPNLLDAKSAYGAIVYQKAPAVLKQLNFFLGEDTFRDGLRLYLAQHSYSNAEWQDLIHAFEQASQTNKQPKDVQTWAKAWILQRGMPEVNVTYSCSSGRINTLTVTQRDVLGSQAVWPVSSEWLLGFKKTDKQVRISWDKASKTGKELGLLGQQCPDYILLNADDYGYGRFLVNASTQTALRLFASEGDVGYFEFEQAAQPGPVMNDIPPLRLASKPGLYVDTPLGHAMVWGSLWDSVRVTHLAPYDFGSLALHALPHESDESLNRIQGARIATCLHAYLGQEGKRKLRPLAEQIIAGRMLHAPTLNLRIVNFRTFTQIAETPAALHTLKDILALNLPIEGLTLRPLDRWNIVGHLIQMNDPEADDAFHHEQRTDTSGEGQKYAYAVAAGTPKPEVKSLYFNQYLHSTTIQEDWLTQSLRPFNAWNQSALTEPYLTAALDALPTVKRTRKIFFLGAWLSAFIDGQHTLEAQAAVHTWLAQHTTLDPDLRLKVLEVSDALDRTVTIRQRFPE